MQSNVLVSIIGGLGGMFGWGVSDFLANLAADKVGHNKTLFWSQVAGLVTLGLGLWLVAPTLALSPFLISLVVFCGLAYTFGYLFFYRGFEVGNVSVVSAVINSQNLFVVAIGLLRGQTLSPFQVVALVLLFLGVFLVSVNLPELMSGKISLTKGVKETLIASVLFGVFYWPLNEFIVEQANWLLIAALTKVVALATLSFVSLWQRKSLAVAKSTPKMMALLIGVGVLEAVGVMGANFGVAYGDGVIVAPIASSLTIVTVGLAMIFLKERISRVQVVGIGLTIVGIVLAAF